MNIEQDEKEVSGCYIPMTKQNSKLHFILNIGNRQFAASEIRNVTENNETDASNNVTSNQERALVLPNDISRDVNRQRSRQSSTSFFAIFYERPVRRRYYRQFNRSATNLVRRLSQSRIFLNSSRAQNAAYRNNYQRRHRLESANIEPSESDAMCNGPNQSVIDMEEDEILPDDTMQRFRGSVHSLNISTDNQAMENRLSVIRTFASENDVFDSCERSETPPPPYNIVANDIQSCT